MRVDSSVVRAGKYGFRQDLFATLYLRPPAVKVISLPQRNRKRAVAVAVAERQRRLLDLILPPFGSRVSVAASLCCQCA